MFLAGPYAHGKKARLLQDIGTAGSPLPQRNGKLDQTHQFQATCTRSKNGVVHGLPYIMRRNNLMSRRILKCPVIAGFANTL